MSYVMKIHANEHAGQVFVPPVFLKSFDVDAHGGRGDIEATSGVGDALRFSTREEAIETWGLQSNVLPTRPDGEPNCPLTTFTVEVIELLEN